MQNQPKEQILLNVSRALAEQVVALMVQAGHIELSCSEEHATAVEAVFIHALHRVTAP